MRLVTFDAKGDGRGRLGALEGDIVVDLRAAAESIGLDGPVPESMLGYCEAGEDGKHRIEQVLARVRDAQVSHEKLQGHGGGQVIWPWSHTRLLAPLPRPRRIRDYLTYEQHATGVGAAVPEAFSQMPICYQGNVDSVIGPEAKIPWPAYTDQLDFELEVGIVVGRGGRNLSVADAADHIAGVTIFNDISARDIQMFEMSMMIGPSKGKDFCNVLGPAMLTMDEVDEYAIELTARVNGETWTRGTSAHRRYSFAEVLAWASYCEDLHLGEFLAVGTVGGGCGAELDCWVCPGDVVELEASGIGVLRNTIGQPEHIPNNAGLPSYMGAPPMRAAGAT